MFIVIEGLDGSGKSTVADELSQLLGAELYKTPPADYSVIREFVNNSENRDAAFYYYLSSVFHASSQIEALIQKGKSVVCDRYYYTTLTAYPDILEATYVDFWLHVDKLVNRFFQPDFAFFLNVSNVKEREQRLRKRGELSADDLDSLNAEIIQRTITAYKRFKFIEIETSGLTITQVVAQVKAFVTDAG